MRTARVGVENDPSPDVPPGENLAGKLLAPGPRRGRVEFVNRRAPDWVYRCERTERRRDCRGLFFFLCFTRMCRNFAPKRRVKTRKLPDGVSHHFGNALLSGLSLVLSGSWEIKVCVCVCVCPNQTHESTSHSNAFIPDCE